MKNFQTDLAVEAHESYVGDGINAPGGVEIDEKMIGDIKRTLVKITSETAEKDLQKKRGSYITIEYGKLQFMSEENVNNLTELVEYEVRELLEKKKVPEAFRLQGRIIAVPP